MRGFILRKEVEKVLSARTPLRSICKYCTDMRLETEIILLYGNHFERDIVFRREFEEMQERNKNLKVVFTVSEPSESWTGHRGRINAQIIEREITWKEYSILAVLREWLKQLRNCLKTLVYLKSKAKKRNSQAINMNLLV